MTARDRLADAYEEQAAVLTRLAEVTAQVAHELRGIEPDAARASVAAVVPSGEPVAAAGGPSPAAVICPKHRVEFLPSKTPGWQPYCPSVSDDPAWSNRRGYCSINPKNAPQWLRVQAA